MKLSILICSIEERKAMCDRLVEFLRGMDGRGGGFEVLVNRDDAQETVGHKRNELLKAARGEYVAFIDDDDWVAQDYVPRLLGAVKEGPDCVDLWGVVTLPGERKTQPRNQLFYHSNRFALMARGGREGVTCGQINHLNCVRREHWLAVPTAGGGPFPEMNFGEDERGANALAETGLLVKEASAGEEILYYYLYDPMVSRAQYRMIVGPGYRKEKQMIEPSFICNP